MLARRVLTELKLWRICFFSFFFCVVSLCWRFIFRYSFFFFPLAYNRNGIPQWWIKRQRWSFRIMSILLSFLPSFLQFIFLLFLLCLSMVLHTLSASTKSTIQQQLVQLLFFFFQFIFCSWFFFRGISSTSPTRSLNPNICFINHITLHYITSHHITISSSLLSWSSTPLITGLLYSEYDLSLLLSLSPHEMVWFVPFVTPLASATRFSPSIPRPSVPFSTFFLSFLSGKLHTGNTSFGLDMFNWNSDSFRIPILIITRSLCLPLSLSQLCLNSFSPSIIDPQVLSFFLEYLFWSFQVPFAFSLSQFSVLSFSFFFSLSFSS